MEGKNLGLQELEGGKVGFTSQPYKPWNHDVLRGDSPRSQGMVAWVEAKGRAKPINLLFDISGPGSLKGLETLQLESRCPESWSPEILGPQSFIDHYDNKFLCGSSFIE
jgi:hypothetical protein